jgi:hypothetical protein
MIEINEPKLEALIMERRRVRGFDSIEETLFDALMGSTSPQVEQPSSNPTSAEILAVFQRCPVKDFDFEPESAVMPISEPVKF